MADTEEKRGPLSEQLVQARLDAANRDMHGLPPHEETEPPGAALEVPAARSATVTRRDTQWVREVRLGIEVLTNMRHQPPPPPPPGWEPEPRRGLGKLYRRGLGRVL